ncbi:hypothetical protein [uncultured Bacteroides sp.]|uniref:hypothetical protein n=1 Tax=uncultured Bacteroides sp. TaxID=162156 RepID=UPI002AA6F8B3|nr:hypothetical protein [uncultured Bacteroides sp.]
MNITISIKKAAVYDEVSKLTGYVGSKTVEDTGKSYDRVFTTDDDKLMLERFWREACNSSTDEFKQFISSVSIPSNVQTIDDAEVYEVVMDMPSSFDALLTSSIEGALNSYFVNMITSKWFAISNSQQMEFYRNEALSNGNEVKRKIYFRKKPIRIIPN